MRRHAESRTLPRPAPHLWPCLVLNFYASCLVSNAIPCFCFPQEILPPPPDMYFAPTDVGLPPLVFSDDPSLFHRPPQPPLTTFLGQSNSPGLGGYVPPVLALVDRSQRESRFQAQPIGEAQLLR